MKKLMYLPLLVIFFIACDTDDSDDQGNTDDATGFIFIESLDQNLEFDIIDSVQLEENYLCNNMGGANDGVNIGDIEFAFSNETITIDGDGDPDQYFVINFINPDFVDGLPDGTYSLVATDENEMACELIFIDFGHADINVDTTDENGENGDLGFGNGTVTVSENGTRFEFEGEVFIYFDDSPRESIGQANGVFELQ